MKSITESRNTSFGITEGKQTVIGFRPNGDLILSGKNGNVTQHMKLDATNNAFEIASQWSKGLASSFSKEAFANFILRVAMSKKPAEYFSELKRFQKSKLPYGVSKHGILVNIAFDGSKYKGEKPSSAQTDIMPMFDAKYKIAQEQMGKVKEVHTSNDRIAHDAVMQELKKGTKIVLHYQNGKNGHASDKRLERAADKLSAAGFEVELK